MLYKEVQYMGMRWTWVMMGVMWAAIVVGLGLLVWWLLSEDTGVDGSIIVGTVAFSGVVAILFTLLIPLFQSQMRMETSIDGEKIRIFLWPWFRRSFDLAMVVKVTARRCQPFREFGSYGAKRKRGWGTAYLIKGNMGVELGMSNGRHVYIGSGSAEELAAVIERWREERAVEC